MKPFWIAGHWQGFVKEHTYYVYTFEVYSSEYVTNNLDDQTFQSAWFSPQVAQYYHLKGDRSSVVCVWQWAELFFLWPGRVWTVNASPLQQRTLLIHPQLWRLKQGCRRHHRSYEKLCLLLSHLTGKSAELALLQPFSISRWDPSYHAVRKTGDSFVQKYSFQCSRGDLTPYIDVNGIRSINHLEHNKNNVWIGGNRPAFHTPQIWLDVQELVQ